MGQKLNVKTGQKFTATLLPNSKIFGQVNSYLNISRAQDSQVKTHGVIEHASWMQIDDVALPNCDSSASQRTLREIMYIKA